MSTPPLDIRAYAALAAALAVTDQPRAALLRAHGLDEAGWEALDRVHQDRLSRAMNEEHEGVPPLVAAYAEAFAAAQAEGRWQTPEGRQIREHSRRVLLVVPPARRR